MLGIAVQQHSLNGHFPGQLGKLAPEWLHSGFHWSWEWRRWRWQLELQDM